MIGKKITPLKYNASIEETLAIFFISPLRQFENGEMHRGYFKIETRQLNMSKKLIKKLVKKGKLAEGQVIRKKVMHTFYKLNIKIVTNDLQNKVSSVSL